MLERRPKDSLDQHTRLTMQLRWMALGLLFACAALGLVVTASGMAASGDSAPHEKERLELEKLRQDVRKLELENNQADSVLGQLLVWAPFLTSLVAVFGAGLTLWKQIDETSRRQEREIKQREQENLRRFSENFAVTAKNLGDESEGVQAGAAASLMTFLKPEYQAFSEDVFLLLLASLKVKRDRAVADLLVRALEKALPLELNRLAERAQRVRQKGIEPARVPLDLARTYLYRAEFSRLDCTMVDLDVAYANLEGANLSDSHFHRLRAFGAKLRKARLSRAVLVEAGLNSADAREASFHGANLVSAKLKEARLNKAQFQQARLQEAHLEGASLEGARFEGADLNNAFFAGAILDLSAKRSITRANHWEKANFDDSVLEELRRLVGA